MKKIVIFILILLSALTSFAQYQPSDFGTCGLGLEKGKNQLSIIFSGNAYHWDCMYRCNLYNGKDEGSYGQHYSSVMSSYHYSGRTYLGQYKKDLGGMGMYNGYIVKQFAFGIYLGYEEYETGETYGNPNHVSTWDEIYSVNYTIHTKFVYGIYARWYANEYFNFFCSYKFNTNSSALSFGLVFNWFQLYANWMGI